MGIPIDKVDCSWHVEVMQKVPLSVDRSSVRYGYLEKVAQAAAEIMADQMTEDQSREAYVAKALEYMEDDEAVRTLISKRFGDKVVVHDPSAPESNKRAMDAGYTVVRGGEFSKAAWDSIRRSKAMEPAGRIFETGQATISLTGQDSIARSDWTSQMEALARYVAAFGEHTIGEALPLQFFDDPYSQTEAICGEEIGLALNLSSPAVKSGLKALGDWGMDRHHKFDELLIHEHAHHFSKDHLTKAYYEACCRIGAKLRTLDAVL
jgi:hypothetical protein